MALYDNGLKVGTGLAIGIGLLILAPLVAPAVAPAVAAVVKPMVKASIKSGMVLFEKTREMIAEAKESLEDLAAEAHAELVQQRHKEASAPVSEAGDGASAY